MPRRQHKAISSKLLALAFRLNPHEDLRKSILEFGRINSIKAGAIVSVAGSLEQYNIRYANRPEGKRKTGHFEIISLTGTFSDSSCHLHISVADRNGKILGGHLLDENLIYTTGEIVVIKLLDLAFMRTNDPTYNYRELVVTKKRARRK